MRRRSSDLDELRRGHRAVEDKLEAKVKELNGDKLLPFSPDVKNIITNSRDPEELQYYWEQWREQTGQKYLEQYKQYIDLYNEAAELNGFR